MTDKPPSEIELVFDVALDDLRSLLGEAIDYLDRGEHLAALGTMVMFDERVEAVRAALLLFGNAIRKRRRR